MVKESSRDTNLKKKRKSSNAPDTNEADIYRKSIEFEEKEAVSRPSFVDAQLYFETCREIRALLAEIGELKLKVQSTEIRNKLQEKTTEICLKIVLLKKLNRMEKVRQVAPKDLLNQEKQKVDSINLQYQNLLYEANHLISEYRKCFQFKSKDENIELVSVDEFLSEAPKNLTEKFQKFDENNETLKHELRLARLEWELQQRIQLAEKCKQLEEEKKKLLDVIEERKSRLSKLGPLLKNVIEATKPLQDHLGLNIDKIQAEHKLASLLPYPMYIFYANVDAYKQVNDTTMNVVIVGDQDEAYQWKQLQENHLNSNNYDDDGDSEGDEEAGIEVQEVEDIVEVKKRRHRKSIQVVNPIDEKRKKLLELHPLSIEVTVTSKLKFSIKIKFFYCVKLGIITIKSEVDVPSEYKANTAREVLSSESILFELIEGDFGLESPNPCTSYQLKKVEIPSFKSLVADLGYAYNWAQKVCGLDFLTKKYGKICDQTSQTNVELFLTTLKKRLYYRHILAKLLENLEQNIIPTIPCGRVPRSTISSLTKWASISYQDFCQCKFGENLINAELISSNDLFYLAKITRAHVELNAYIVIHNDYPLTSPIFILSLNYDGDVRHSLNDDSIRDIERSVNVNLKPEGNNQTNWLLATQISTLCTCLDIYLETEDPKQFTQNTMYIKACCARNRRKPFRFRDVGVGVFTQ